MKEIINKLKEMVNNLEQRFSKCEAASPGGVPEGFRGGAATEKIK